MSQTHLSVIYGGPALKKGAMDVKQLGPALSALGELCERAHYLINGEKTGASVLIKSDFQAGSFEFDISFMLSAWEAAEHFFQTSEYKTAKEIIILVGLLGPYRTGVYRLIKRLKKRKYSARKLPSGNIEIQTDDNEVYEISQETYSLFQDLQTRRLIGKTVAPLAQEGIDTFETKQDGKRGFKMDKSDLPSYLLNMEDEVINQNTEDMILQVDTPFLTDTERKWRFTRINGKQQKIIASIKDPDYLNAVKTRKYSFSSGMLIQATVVSKEIRRADGKIKTEWEIERIINHDVKGLL